jgi:arylsulfatase A-like enzyme/uncharacterized protein (DUF1330 family)
LIEKIQLSATDLRSMKQRLAQYGPRLIMMATVMCLMTTLVAAAERKPNIIVIVADDLGYADVGFQGGRDIPTPNLDQLAARGIRLSSGYASGVWCTPTRAGLLTGRYQQRFGEHGHEHAPDTALDLAETTLAQRLRAAGYATGLVGKWHLGTSDEYHPQRRGFDEFFGFLPGAHNFLPDLPIIIFPDRNGDGEDLGANAEVRARLDKAIMRGTEFVHEPGYLTEAFGREGVSFVRRHADQPFFLYLSFNAVHTPMQATDPLLEMFASVQDPVRRAYNAMTYSMDDAIGAVLDQLRASGIEENTLVFFISDNGGPTLHRYGYNASNNTPLRGSKGTTLEGGIRIPFVVSWPGTLEGGGVFGAPAITLDIAPTALAAAGISVEPGMALDGVNLLPHLQGEVQRSPHELLFWRGWGQMAVRQGDWKLVSYVAKMDEGELKRGEARNVMTPYRLYNLRSDIGERQDLAAAEPERVADLLEEWRAWNAEMKVPPQLAKSETTKKELKMTYLDRTEEQTSLLKELDIEGPILMLNMLRYKKDGGREKYREYGRSLGPLLAKAGAKLYSRSDALATLIGDEEWDEILVVEYPSREAFLNMVQSDEYKVPKQMRNEALEDSRLICMQAPKP